MCRADEESRKKDELINEIKRLQKIHNTYQNDQSHLVDLLRQAKRYQQFLFKFSPEVETIKTRFLIQYVHI